ncbi:hypothetical protein G6F62_004377 [Rhizopus arrhizus]|nr:hypothetical protein G6F62_004377 [Rhizopus arrhizus]
MKITAYSASHIVLLLLLLLLLPSPSTQDDSCFSLSGSTTCAAFQDYYISLTGLSTKYPFLKNVTDIKTFDAGLQSFVTSPQLYLTPLGCTDKASVASTIPYARYSKTFLCATLIQDSSYSLPCNYNNSLSPPPLCQQTCFDYMASIESLTNNTDTCPNLVQQRVYMAVLNSTCQYWPGLNGTYNCVIGIANEPNNCGFESESDACDYCKINGTDSCCVSQQFNDSSSVFGYDSLLAASSQRILLPNQQQAFVNHDNTKLPPLTIQPQPIEEFYEVKHPYPPQMGDELGLHIGDIVCVAMKFDDGWALGFNVTTGLKGVFPIVCVAPVPEELLEQLLLQQNESSTKILVEDNIKRSTSIASRNALPITELTQHNNIPRRTASMMRSYDYKESDSPTSPTLNTPFFDPHNPLPQSTSSNQEAFEMQGKK